MDRKYGLYMRSLREEVSDESRVDRALRQDEARQVLCLDLKAGNLPLFRVIFSEQKRHDPPDDQLDSQKVDFRPGK
jgi:hypothetical protein